MHKRSGFTIVELLIVIVVIAILAAITIVAYNGVQTRAKASQITAGIKQVDKSFRLWNTERGVQTWDLDTTICGISGGNPQLTVLISSCTGLSSYLQASPSVADPSLVWFYDMDNDSKPNPGTLAQIAQGTNLCISNVSQSIVDILESTLDDGNNLGGRIRYDPSIQRVYYSLSYNQSI
jgi:prepilin-type N-terminal cleavage/methylation domain-containing protein